MFERYVDTPTLATVALIAETIRQQLGDEVEACPGCTRPEQAEPLNRLFRAVVRRLLEPIVESSHDLSRVTSWILRKLTQERLTAGGLDERQIRMLLELEPGTPDDWLTFLLLVPWAEVVYWLEAADEGPECFQPITPAFSFPEPLQRGGNP
jgi:hypothetical protein